MYNKDIRNYVHVIGRYSENQKQKEKRVGRRAKNVLGYRNCSSCISCFI